MTTTRNYDKLNRLTSIASSTASSSSSFTYHYNRADQFEDDRGRRVWKKVTNLDTSTVLPENKFLYDGWNLIATLNAPAVMVQSYVWGSDLSGTLQGAGGVAGLLWITEYAGGSPVNAYFAAYDGNGNVSALARASNGEEKARYEYGPFGEPIRQTGDYANANPMRWSTKYTDGESGLVYYGYRSYNPSTGRWPNRDPLGEPGFTLLNERRNTQRKLTTNPYAFVENNPIIFIDPDGLESVFVRLETEIRPPDVEQGTKTWHYVEINEYGTILSQQSFIGITEIPFPVQGSGTMGATVSGTHPNFTVRFTGSTVSLFIYPGFIALGLGPGILGSPLRIDYDVPVTINFCSHTGTVGGSHDGYPSYMAFVKSKKVYDFQQKGPPNLGTIYLLPPMDVSPSVSFIW